MERRKEGRKENERAEGEEGRTDVDDKKKGMRRDERGGKDKI